MNTKWMMTCIVAGAVTMTACDKKETATSEPAADEGASSKPAPPVKEVPKGLEDPSNDPAVVELARTAVACEWKGGRPNLKCDAAKEWRKSDLLKKGAADSTLVNFLVDPKPEVRWLGATALKSNGKTYREDEAMAAAVVAAVQAEKDTSVASVMGDAVAKIDGAKSGQLDAIKKIITDHPVEEVRAAAVGGFLFHNRSDAGFDFVAGLTKSDKSDKVRLAASKSFWVGNPSNKKDEVCKLWLELASDENKDIAGHSAYHASFFPHGGGCTTEWDALLDLIETKAEGGKVASSFTSSALKYLYSQKKSTDKQKKKALSVAQTLVLEVKNEKTARSSALRFIGETDPDAKKLAGKLKDDKEFFVKSTAKDILEGNIKLKTKK